MKYLKDNWKPLAIGAAVMFVLLVIAGRSMATVDECFVDNFDDVPCAPVQSVSGPDDWETGRHTFTATHGAWQGSATFYSGDMSDLWHLRLERGFGDRFKARVQYADNDGEDYWTAGGIFRVFSYRAFYGDAKGFYNYNDDDSYMSAEAEVGVDYEANGPFGVAGFLRATFDGGIDRDGFDYSGLVFEAMPTYRYKQARFGVGPRWYGDMPDSPDLWVIQTRGWLTF